MSTLFEIVGMHQDLYQLAIDEEIDTQVFEDTLEGLKGELEIKTSGYINVIQQLDMEAKKADELMHQFELKRDLRKDRINRLKSMLLDAMIKTDNLTLDTGEYTVKVVNNGGVEPMIIDGEVPESMCKVILEPDKKRIREAIEKGEDVPYAHLMPRGKHLSIK